MIDLVLVKCQICGTEFETKNPKTRFCRKCADYDDDPAPSRRNDILAVYGNTPLPKAYCPSCKTMSFVSDGNFVCCGREAVGFKPKKFKRESEPIQARKRPSVSKREEMLEKQEHCCFYCGVPFGSVQYRKDKMVTIRINWDHSLPYSYSQNNHADNFVAACHVCNGIKSDKIFQDVDEARLFLAQRRKEKGYSF